MSRKVYKGFLDITKYGVFHLNMSLYDMKTKLFLLKTNVLKFTQQKFERKSQRNKRFIKLFINVQFASPCLHGTHRNGCQTRTSISALMVIKASVIRVFRTFTDVGRGGT